MTDKKKDWKNSLLLPMLTFAVLLLIFGAGTTFLYFEQIESSQQVQELEQRYKERSQSKEYKESEEKEFEQKKNKLDKELKKLQDKATDVEYFEEVNQ